MLKRFALLACLVTGAGLLATGGALADAGGQGTVTITQHASNVELFPPMSVTNPCNGQSGTLSAIAANSVFHVTFFTNGDEFWVTGTGEGTATHPHTLWSERRLLHGTLRRLVRRIQQQQERCSARHEHVRPDGKRRLARRHPYGRPPQHERKRCGHGHLQQLQLQLRLNRPPYRSST